MVREITVHMRSGYDCLKKPGFWTLTEIVSDCADVASSGRAFHTVHSHLCRLPISVFMMLCLLCGRGNIMTINLNILKCSLYIHYLDISLLHLPVKIPL